MIETVTKTCAEPPDLYKHNLSCVIPPMLVQAALIGGASTRIKVKHKNNIGSLTFNTHCKVLLVEKTQRMPEIKYGKVKRKVQYLSPQGILLEMESSEKYTLLTF